MLNIAYIGNGKSTNRYHLPFVLQRKDTYRVASIFDRHADNPRWDKIEGVHYTSDMDEILNDPTIDMIVVCTGVDSHYEYARKVIEHKKHCLVEKPFMETSNQAKEIFALAKQNNVLVQAYQNRRFDSDFLTVQKVIESGVLGTLLEVEMHYDYYRPEVPQSAHSFQAQQSYLYGHGCHTIDQVFSYFGQPDATHFDVRQLLGDGRMNDYFDIDMYYDQLKVSVKSSYFRVKERPSFIVYGTKGCFEKASKDRQEEHLKQFYMPTNQDFGMDLPQHYGTLTYYDENNVYHQEKVVSQRGDYARVYDDFYTAIVDGKAQTITNQQTLLQMELLEQGVAHLK